MSVAKKEPCVVCEALALRKAAGTSEAPWQAPTLADFTDQRWADLTAAERARIAGHFAHAPAGAATFADLKLPYREPDGGAVNLHAVRAILAVLGGARGGVRGLAPAERERLQARMTALLGEPAEDATKDMTGDVHIPTAIGTSNAQARRRPRGLVDVSTMKGDEEEELAKASTHYLTSLMEQAKSYLPPWLHEKIHRLALPRAGGRASAEARKRRTEEDAAALAALAKADGLPPAIVLVEGFVSTGSALTKDAAVPVALHGKYTGRHFLLPGHLVYGALRKAAAALGTVVRYEGTLARDHAAREPLYDLVLLRRGATGDPEPATDADGPRGARIVKADPAQQKLWCVVMEPLVEDTQGDFEHREDIEPAAHRFLEDYRLRKTNLGHSHERPLTDEEAVLCEHYVTPAPMRIGDTTVPAGTWMQVIHVKSAPIWKQVEDGEITGVSFGGTGTRKSVPDAALPAALKRAGAR